MATTPTQLPVPSEKPQDLKFNAGKIDEFVTSMGWTYIDRFGVKHYTIEGIRYIAEQGFSAQLLSQEQRFNLFIQNSGYKVIDDYEDGPLTITEYNQLIRYDNELWKITAGADTPFMTTGNDATSWVVDSAHFVSVGDAALRQNLYSSYEELGSSIVTHPPVSANGMFRSVKAKSRDFPSILDWRTDSQNDDTMRFNGALADGIQHIHLPQGTLNVSDLVISKGMTIQGVGTMGLDGIGTQILVDPEAKFGISFDSTGFARPTGGGISYLSLKCAVAKQGSPDLLKTTRWSYFKLNTVALENTMGWCIRLKDTMESLIKDFNLRASGGENGGGISFDDWIDGDYNNVNNLKIDTGTFGAMSGPWLASTAQSNPDMIWINNIKFEYDAALSTANTSSQYVLDFLNMSRCWISKCGFTHLNDQTNMYQAILHLGPLCGFSTDFTDNKMYGIRCPGVIEGGSLIAHNNSANQADYTGTFLDWQISSRKMHRAEPTILISSNGNQTRGERPEEPGLITAHKLGGSINHAFIVDASASQSTVMSIEAGQQIRSIPMPASVLDGTSVVNLSLRVRCADTAGANSTIGVFIGATSLASKTITAANGWQILKVQLKPLQLTGSTLILTNTGAVSILFDSVKFEKSGYIDWNFSFSPGAIAAGSVVTSATQSYLDTIGVSGLIQSLSQPKFDGSTAGLIASVNTYDENGSFTVSLYNPTDAAISGSISRCFIRAFLN